MGFVFAIGKLTKIITYKLLSIGFPAILAQFPETPQFRPVGWFCVAAGVALLLLQLLLFHGECAWNCSGIGQAHTKFYRKLQPQPDKTFCDRFFQIFVSSNNFSVDSYFNSE